jgi:GNAT superfamily N-acetyltransferase
MFAALIEYKRKHGDCKVPHAWPDNPQLATWVVTQRSARSASSLNENRIHRLEEIGFAWDSRAALWEEMFAALLEYKRRYGDCNVPKRWKKNTPLATWISVQRVANRSGKLNDVRIGRLNEIGFVWDPITATKEGMFEALIEFQRKHGHCNVPQRWPENPRLATWIATQRRFQKFGKLGEESIRRLEKLGFVWNSRDAQWEETFAEFVESQRKHADCNVWSHNPKLAAWITAQRQLRKSRKLSKERIRRLEESGITWDTHATVWEEMFEALSEYKRQHGDCKVPNRYRGNPKLNAWVNTQRLFKKKGRLSEARIRRLEQIGFVLDPREALWEEMFGALLDYCQKHGDCNVPYEWTSNPKLGKWVVNQRQVKNTRRLSEERIRRLNEIGFQWRIKAC